MKIPTWAELMRSTNEIERTRKDLLNKNMFPEHVRNYLTDPNLLKAAIYDHALDDFKAWRCPSCGITIHGTKKWMIQHTKIHLKTRKENEAQTQSINPYKY